jgi:hypothetical protein
MGVQFALALVKDRARRRRHFPSGNFPFFTPIGTIPRALDEFGLRLSPLFIDWDFRLGSIPSKFFPPAGVCTPPL